MKSEQLRPIPRNGGNVVVPLHHVIVARALRDLKKRERCGMAASAVDLAKQSGLLYRLQAILND